MERPRARGGWGVALAVLAVMLLGAESPDTPSPSPTDAPERLREVRTTCRVDRGRDAQTVTCEVDGLPPRQGVRLTVETAPVGTPPRTTWTGSATAGPSGTTTVRAALPCTADGEAPIRVGADAAGSYRHQQDVTLEGRCRPGWLLTGGEVARVVAAMLVLATAALALAARRRELAAARAAARAQGRRRRR